MKSESKPENLYSEILETVRLSVRRAFEQERALIVLESVARMEGAGVHGQAGEQSPGRWIVVDSLSRLRKEVGGRFQSIKERWLRSGFPLKAHRGAKVPDYAVDLSGWEQLQTWIRSQGYDAELLEPGTAGFFRVKKRLSPD